MTIIERDYEDSIVIPSLGVCVKVGRLRKGKVNLIIFAPDAVSIKRGEVVDATTNVAAAAELR